MVFIYHHFSCNISLYNSSFHTVSHTSLTHNFTSISQLDAALLSQSTLFYTVNEVIYHPFHTTQLWFNNATRPLNRQLLHNNLLIDLFISHISHVIGRVICFTQHEKVFLLLNQLLTGLVSIMPHVGLIDDTCNNLWIVLI